MQETRTYSYQDLLAASQKLNGKYAYSGYTSKVYSDSHEGRTLPILRGDEVVWTDQYTTEEYNCWQRMCVGADFLLQDLRFEESKVTGYKVQVAHPEMLMVVTPFSPLVNFNMERQDTYKRAADLWHIPYQDDITSYAALFYVLYYKARRGNQAAKDELDYFISSHAPVIARYLDMAAGGEVRHMKQHTYVKGTAPSEIEEEAFSSGQVYKTTASSSLFLKDADGAELIGLKAKQPILPSDRAMAWLKWKEIRDRAGIMALNWCIMMHYTGAGGYGGVLWANIASLVRKWEKHEISSSYMIDQAFSLQHNGGPVFTKIWQYDHLTTVLDLAFKSAVEELPRYISKPEFKAIYNRVCVGVDSFDAKETASHRELTLAVRITNQFKQESTVLGIKPNESIA